MKQSISCRCSKTYRKCPEINDYFAKAKSKKIRINKNIKALISHVDECFKNEQLYIEQEKLDQYMKLQALFPYKLTLWEKCVFALHNCVRKKSDDELRWPDLFLFVGRGNGKNGYFSFESFALATPINGIMKYDIDMCAMSEDQARTSFDDLFNMMESNPEVFSQKWTWTKTEIINKTTQSKIKYRTNTASSKQGLRSGLAYMDELEEFKDNATVSTFLTGLGKEKIDMDGNKRSDPRTTYTSTNGDKREGPLDDNLDKANQILFLGISDNGFLPFVYCLNEAKEVYDKKNWILANPSINDMPTLRKRIEKEYIDYKRNPIKYYTFMSLRMNIAVEKKTNPVASWDDISATNQKILSDEELKKLRCILGIDYAKTSDMVAAVLLFKDFVTGKIYTKQHLWFCTHSSDWNRVNKEFVHECVIKGTMTIVDAVEIEPQQVIDWAMHQGFCIQMAACDTYRLTLIRKALQNAGFDTNSKESIKLTRPSDVMMVVPIINSLLINRNLCVGDDPAFRWCLNNTQLEPCEHNNFRYEKIESKSRKNDMWMAFVHAMTCVDKLPDNSIKVSDVPEVWTF